MAKKSTRTLALLAIAVGVLALASCGMPQSSNNGTPVAASLDTTYYAGTAAFTDSSAVVGVTMQGSSARAVVSIPLFALVQYKNKDIVCYGTYDTVTHEFAAAGSWKDASIDVSFAIKGTLDFGILSGTIVKTEAGQADDPAKFMATISDIRGTNVKLYAGTYGNVDNPAEWGTFNVGYDDTGAVQDGTWKSTTGAYSGFLGPLPASADPALAYPSDAEKPSAFGIFEGGETLSESTYIGYATTTSTTKLVAKGQFFDTYVPGGEGTWEAANVPIAFRIKNSVINDIAVDDAGNVFAVGMARDETIDWSIASYDKDGNKRWDFQMGSKDGELYGVAVSPLDQSVFVVGSYDYRGTGDKDWLIRQFYNDYPSGTGVAIQTFKPEYGNFENGALNGIGVSTKGEDIAYDVTVDNMGIVYVVGTMFDAAGSGNKDWATVAIDPYMPPALANPIKFQRPISGDSDSKDGELLGVAVAHDADGNPQYLYEVGWYEFGSDKDWLIRRIDLSAPTDAGGHVLFTRPNFLVNGAVTGQTSGKGGGDQIAHDVAVDEAGNVYVTGSQPAGSSWGVTVYDPTGALLWEKWLGKSPGGNYALAIDGAGGIYTAGSYDTAENGNFNWLLRKFDSALKDQDRDNFFSNVSEDGFIGDAQDGSGLVDEALAIAFDPLTGNIWVGGYSTEANSGGLPDTPHSGLLLFQATGPGQYGNVPNLLQKDVFVPQ